MRARRSSPCSCALRRAPAGARALACVAAALLGGTAPARASDLSGRAELTYGEDEGLASSSDYLRQTYLLNYRRQVTVPTSYQLTLRYRDDRGALRFGEERSDLRLRSFAPSAAIDHRMEGFGLNLSYRRNDEATLDPEVDRFRHRTIERYSGGFYVRPFERGDFSVGVDRLAFRAASVDTLDERVAVGFRYTSDSLRLVNEFRVQRADDNLAQSTRMSIGPRITAAYSRVAGTRHAISAQYILDYFLTEQETLANVPVTVAVEAQPAAGLFATDNLPVDTDPLVSEPRLIDRSLDVSAGVSIGPTGTSFNNLGLDMGRFFTIDELRVHVRDAAGQPIAQGGSVIWTTYSSQDGLRWALVDGAVATFSPGLSAYVIDFPPASARFFKVVNFGVNAVETFVTELQPFTRETLQPRTTRTSSAVRQGIVLALATKPMDKVTLDYSTLLNADMIAPDRGPRRWFTDWSNAATARFGPHGDFLYGLGQTFTIAREPGGLTQSAWATSGSARYQPIQRYSSTLEARVGSQVFERAFPTESVRTTTLGTTLSNNFDVYDSLRLALNAGVSRQQFEAGASNDFLSASAYAHADLRRDLSLRLESSMQRSLARRGELTPAEQGVPLLRIITYELHTAQLRYWPTPQLTLTARVGYASAEAGDGVIQSYQAAWSPFPGGAVQLAFDYSQDVDPLTGRSFRRFTALPRWQINKRAHLQLSYNHARGTGEPPVRQQNLLLTLSLSL